MTKIYVIGIGYKPFNKWEREIIHHSDFILSSSRLFEVFKRYEEFAEAEERVRVIDTVDETINFIRAQNIEQKTKTSHSELRTIVLLASGDPLFFGIGRRVISEFGKDMVEILPDLSSIQVAFSKIKEPWDNAFFMSLHGGPDPKKRRRLEYEIEDIPVLLERHKKIAILTDRENNPAEIAKVLTLSPITYDPPPVMYVCERLGYPEERITRGRPEAIAGRSFSYPNVVIILLEGSINNRS